MKHLLYYYKQFHDFSGRTLYINLLGMILISLLQGTETFLLIPIISVSGIINLNSGFKGIEGLFKVLNGLPQVYGLLLILAAYVLLVVGQSLLQRKITLRNVKIHQSFVLHLRMETYRAILHANWNFFIKKRKSDIINSLTAELSRVSSGLAVFLHLLTSLIFTLIQIGFAFWLSAKLTIFVLACGVVLAFLNRRFVGKAKKLGNLTSELSQNYLASMTDQLNGIKEIKSNSLEESRLRYLGSLMREMQHEQHEYVDLRTNAEFWSKLASSTLVAFCIFFSVKILQAQPQHLLLIVMIFSRLWPRFSEFQANLEQMASSISAFQALRQLRIESDKAQELIDGDQFEKYVKLGVIEQGLECRSVFFRYNPQESIYVLQDITLQIPANRMTAIVGRSGAGKSTLIDILMGLMQPERGEVLVDGTPLGGDNILALRRSVSYVPQDPFLFNTSIRENLLLIEPNATEEELWYALEFSASAEFVKRFPQGLDTIIGDRGVRLSGGERQRLVLARAILRKPSILVLDEATSSLDTENETKIQEVLDRLKGSMTIIVIAHRLSTIRNADQVIVLDRGKVVQKGGFSQLAQEKRGLFSSLLGNQVEVSL